LEGYIHLLLKAANFRTIPDRQAAEVSCIIGIQYTYVTYGGIR